MVIMAMATGQVIIMVTGQVIMAVFIATTSTTVMTPVIIITDTGAQVEVRLQMVHDLYQEDMTKQHLPNGLKHLISV